MGREATIKCPVFGGLRRSDAIDYLEVGLCLGLKAVVLVDLPSLAENSGVGARTIELFRLGDPRTGNRFAPAIWPNGATSSSAIVSGKSLGAGDPQRARVVA